MIEIKETGRTIDIPIEEYNYLIRLDATVCSAIEYASRNSFDMSGVLRIINTELAREVAGELEEDKRQKLNKAKEEILHESNP